jgi:hypothetical protein
VVDTMNRQYLRYVLRHKWYVFVAACRLGVPWLGLLHDLSKFTPQEWVPYARHFFGPQRRPEGGTNAAHDQDGYDAASIQAAYDRAWLVHIHRNAHHWQHWVLLREGGVATALPMPDRYRREMLADWIGAGRAQGSKSGARDWYVANRGKMQLHDETRAWVERQLL